MSAATSGDAESKDALRVPSVRSFNEAWSPRERVRNARRALKCLVQARADAEPDASAKRLHSWGKSLGLVDDVLKKVSHAIDSSDSHSVQRLQVRQVLRKWFEEHDSQFDIGDPCDHTVTQFERSLQLLDKPLTFVLIRELDQLAPGWRHDLRDQEIDRLPTPLREPLTICRQLLAKLAGSNLSEAKKNIALECIRLLRIVLFGVHRSLPKQAGAGAPVSVVARYLAIRAGAGSSLQWLVQRRPEIYGGKPGCSRAEVELAALDKELAVALFNSLDRLFPDWRQPA